MSKSKKPPKKSVPIADIEHPGTTAASPTSKPVIVTNRPIIKDPMVVEDVADEQPKLTAKKTSTKPKLQPLTTSVESEDSKESTTQEKPVVDAVPAPAESKSSKKTPEESEELDRKRKEERAANLQKIANAKTYYLPINSVEKRKTKRFVVLGILLSILLIMIWVDIALDAELIRIDGITPVTSFF